jgi:hypothetical protein
MARGVEHVEPGCAERQRVAVAGFGIDGDALRRGYAQPGGLFGQHIRQRAIVGIHEHGRAGGLLEFVRAADMVDVRVGDDDGLQLEPVALENLQNAADLVAGIDHHGLAGLLVSEDGAVALQRTDRQDLVDHSSIVAA